VKTFSLSGEFRQQRMSYKNLVFSMCIIVRETGKNQRQVRKNIEGI